MNTHIIGSHNSSAYEINFDIDIFPKGSKWDILRRMALKFPCIRNKIIKITKNQKFNIVDQLNMGVSLIELYVSRTKDGIFYCSHTFATIKLDKILSDIYNYAILNIHKHIYIIIRPDPNNKQTVVNYEHDLLMNFISLPINIVLYYDNINISIPNSIFTDIFPLSNLDIDWYNTDNLQKFIDTFDEKKYDNSNKLSGIKCILTPQMNITIIFKNIEPNAKKINNIMCKKIKDLPLQNKPYIIIFDYIDNDIFNILFNNENKALNI